MNRIAALFVLGAIALAGTSCNSEPNLEVAPNVDLSRFQGKWYEIASLPRTTQVDCYGTTAFYSRAPDGTYRFVNQCNVESTTGPLRTVTMKATVPNQANPAKLAVEVGGYSGDYWILDVGSNYEYAVVGHPTRMYLWILSRTPMLDDATLKGVLDRAQARQFNTAKLQYTPQPPPIDRLVSMTPVEAASSATNGGCAVSAGKSDATGKWLVGLALALAVWRPRQRVAITGEIRNRAGQSKDRLRRSSDPGCSGCT
jgi:apolipoprotein D and lipocalin family protein